MRKRVSGIYVIANTKNGHVYIGQTTDFASRWYKHKFALNANKHQNNHLQNAWNKYGEKAFKFKRLEHCEIDQLDEREQHYVTIYMEKGICYNVSKYINAPNRGRHLSEETKRKIGQKARGRKLSPQQIEKMRAFRIGTKLSEETKAKMSASRMGRVVSEETRKKISDAHKGKSSKNKGKKASEETRRKLSESARHRSDEHRRKLSEAAKAQHARKRAEKDSSDD